MTLFQAAADASPDALAALVVVVEEAHCQIQDGSGSWKDVSPDAIAALVVMEEAHCQTQDGSGSWKDVSSDAIAALVVVKEARRQIQDGSDICDLVQQKQVHEQRLRNGLQGLDWI